jgi:hypothetical protein
MVYAENECVVHVFRCKGTASDGKPCNSPMASVAILPKGVTVMNHIPVTLFCPSCGWSGLDHEAQSVDVRRLDWPAIS